MILRVRNGELEARGYDVYVCIITLCIGAAVQELDSEPSAISLHRVLDSIIDINIVIIINIIIGVIIKFYYA